jgi:DNA-binding beta-propeller fold protein YncE
MPRSRRTLALSALAVLAFAALPARAEQLGFILNSGDASISIVDVQTHHEIRREPVLREPHHIVLSPDGRSVLVGDTGANEMLFLDPATGQIKRRIPVSDPYQLQFSPDGSVLTVTGLARNQVDIYSADSMQLLHRIKLSAMPSHIAYAPDSSVAYVTLQETDRLAAIVMKSGAVLWNAKVGETPAGVLWHDGKLLVGDMGADDVAVVDPTDGSVERRIHTGRGAHNLFLSPDRRLIYVSNRVDSTITVLNADTLDIQRQYKVPGGPDDLAFAPDGTIWVTQRFAHGLLFLDPATGATTRIDVGRSPHGLWLNTDQPTRVSSAR